MAVNHLNNQSRWVSALRCAAAMSLSAPLLAQAVPARAAPILSTLNYVDLRSTGFGDPFLQPITSYYACANTNGVACSGTVLAPQAGPNLSNLTDWTVHYFAQSQSGFGILRGQADVTITGDNALGQSWYTTVGGRAGFEDTFTFNGCVGNATATFNFFATGTNSSTGGNIGGGDQMHYVPVVNGQLDYNNQLGSGFQNGNNASLAIPITCGVPLPAEFDFYALDFVQAAGKFSSTGWYDGAAATADYFDTVILDQITVRDSSGNVVPFFITSASG